MNSILYIIWSHPGYVYSMAMSSSYDGIKDINESVFKERVYMDMKNAKKPRA